MKNTVVYKQLVARIGIIFLMILVLMGSMLYVMETFDRYRDYEYFYINSVGRLNMLTDTMAQDVYEISLLSEFISSARQTDSILTQREMKNRIQGNLSFSRNEFERILNSLGQGYLNYNNVTFSLEKNCQIVLNPALQTAYPVWIKFGDAVSIVGDPRSSDRDIVGNQIIIDESYELLKEQIGKITHVITGSRWQWHEHADHVFVWILSFQAVVVIFSLLSIYYHFFLPFEALKNSAGFSRTIEASKFPTLFNTKPIIQEMNSLNEKVKKLVDTVTAINDTSSFQETLEYIFSTFKAYIPYSYIGVGVYKDYALETIVASYGVSDGTYPNLPQRLVGYEIEIEKTSLLEVQMSGKPRIINDLVAYNVGRRVRGYNRIIMEEGICASITLPLKINNRPLGFMFFSSKEKHVYTPEHVEFLNTIGSAIAMSFDKNIFTNDMVYSSILALAKLAEARDEDTGEHLERMKRYTALLLNCLKDDEQYSAELSKQFMHDVERFSPMHDIGKVGVSDGILMKPGRLTANEFEEMKTHSVYGASVMAEAERNINRSGRSLFSVGLEIAESHHERWNGTGYPNGLSAENIPLSARVVSLADVLDALTTRRPYKEAFTFDKSVQIILEEKGTQFDPVITDTFYKHVEKFRNLHKEMTDNIKERLNP